MAIYSSTYGKCISEPKDWGKCGSCIYCLDIGNENDSSGRLIGVKRKCKHSSCTYISYVKSSCSYYEFDGNYNHL